MKPYFFHNCLHRLWTLALGLWTLTSASAQTPSFHATAIDLTVMVNSNGALVAPTNFFSANASLITDPNALHSTSNFADLNSPATARANLGLASAATNAASAFQPANANLTNWSALATNQATLTNDTRPVSLTNSANTFAGSFTGSNASLNTVTAQSLALSNAAAGYVVAVDAAHNLTNSAVLSANLPDVSVNNNFTGTNNFATNNTTLGNFGNLTVSNGVSGEQRTYYAIGQSITASSSGSLVYMFGIGTTTLSTIGSSGQTTQTPLINGTTIFLLPTNIFLGRSTALGSGTNLYLYPQTNGVVSGQQFYVWKGDGTTVNLYANLVSNGPLTGVTNLGWAVSNNSSGGITGNYPQVPFVQISTQ